MTEIPRPDPPLAAGGVALRAFVPADAPRVVVACTDPVTRRFLPDLPDPYGEAEAHAWIASHEPARRSGASLTCAVVAVDGEQVHGAVTAMFDEPKRSVELGYWLAPDARGGGRMTGAVGLLAAWLFAERGTERVEILTEPDNRASAAIPSRCGFTREGHLRRHLRDHTGVRRDTVVWGLLPGELRSM